MKFTIFIFICFFNLNTIFANNNLYSPYNLNILNLSVKKPEHLSKGSISLGEKIFKSRKVNCLSCHEAPLPEEKFQGNVGPSLSGVGSRYNKDEIRIRIIDAKKVNAETIMPSYFKKFNYPRTPEKFLGKTILQVEEVEHLVEYLYSLK